MTENELKSVFIDTNFQNKLSNLIDCKFSRIVPEVKFINGIKADFALYDNKEQIVSIVECKGDDIGVTEYVRGIGQITQYEYFKRSNIGNNINPDCRVFLSFPSSLMSGRAFDILKFAYPKNIELLIVNTDNKSPLVINPHKDREKIQRDLKTTQISPYFFHGNRIAELYIILLEIVKKHKLHNHKGIERGELGAILAKYGTPTKGNSRNAFTSLRALGLINSKNIQTIKGYELASLDYACFFLNYSF